MDNTWETEIGGLLTELSEVQTALLSLLSEKRLLIAAGDHVKLSSLGARETELSSRLQACHDRRQQLLAQASEDGLPVDSIRALSDQLPAESRGRVQASIQEAAERTKLLQNQSLASWVLVQRSLLHLSQMIEIIATGGRPKPTYGKGSDRAASGALVDRAA